jgi:hypothetical protein
MYGVLRLFSKGTPPCPALSSEALAKEEAPIVLPLRGGAPLHVSS